MSEKARAQKGPVSSLRRMRKMERLALIKERYRRLILEPRQRIEMELDQDVADDYLDEELESEPEGVFAEFAGEEDEI